MQVGGPYLKLRGHVCVMRWQVRWMYSPHARKMEAWVQLPLYSHNAPWNTVIGSMANCGSSRKTKDAEYELHIH